MIATVFLLLYSGLVIVAGPPLLRRLTRDAQAPRLGVAAWLTAIVTVLVSWVAALAVLIAELAGHWDHRDNLVAFCVAQLRVIATGEAGALPRLALWALTIAVAGPVALTAVRLAARLTDIRRRSHRHAEAVHLVGHRTAAHDVVVLDSAEPAAYCVSGRPPAIVVTSAAVAALNERELDAVVAHERAHLAGHHPHIVAALRGLAAALPRLPLMTQGAEHVSRLLEMCADDAAARRHGREALLTGLLAMTGSTPAGTLGAATVAVLERVRRLSAPPAGIAPRRVALTSTITMTISGPVIIAAMAVSGLLMCGM